MQNLRSTRQTELEDHYPTHVVNYWMNNSVRVAQKHYLQITDDHHLAGCGITPESKAVSPAVTAASFMPIHAPSAKTQTLQNKAFPVTDPHDPSQEMPKWAMRDSRPHAFESMKTGVLHVLENTVGPKVGPFLTLSQIVACLIERWDSMSAEEKLAVQLCIDGDAVVESIVAVAPDTT